MLLFIPAKPVVDEHYLKVHIDNTAVLSWKYDVQDISVTTVVIEQCLSDTHCLEHNVTTNTEQMLELSVSDGDIFFLVIYQDGLETYRSQPFSQLSEDNQLPGKLVHMKTFMYKINIIIYYIRTLTLSTLLCKLQTFVKHPKVYLIILYYRCISIVL